jgi:heme-degrading monooxygenase HmoA
VFARTTTIDAQRTSINAGITEIRDTVMPALHDMAGYVGLSLLVDRTTGRCIAASAWDSEQAMRDSDEAIRAVREHAAEVFGGTAETAEWEIAGLRRRHLAGPGTCVRVNWVQIDPEQVERGVDIFKMDLLPALEDLNEYCSASLLVNRESGRVVTSVAYDSLDALQRNRDQIAQIKASASRDSGAEFLEEQDFELTIAHLRVPEMA